MMKITNEQLNQIIQEELEKTLNEGAIDNLADDASDEEVMAATKISDEERENEERENEKARKEFNKQVDMDSDLNPARIRKAIRTLFAKVTNLEKTIRR